MRHFYWVDDGVVGHYTHPNLHIESMGDVKDCIPGGHFKVIYFKPVGTAYWRESAGSYCVFCPENDVPEAIRLYALLQE